MAASHSYLKYAEPGARVRTYPQRLESTENIRLVLGFKRFLLKLACPSHAWNWPRPNHGERVDGFDAHQTCFKCMTQRFYNTQTLKAGPLYRSRVPGTAEPSPRDLAPLPGLRKLRLLKTQTQSIFKLAKRRRG